MKATNWATNTFLSQRTFFQRQGLQNDPSVMVRYTESYARLANKSNLGTRFALTNKVSKFRSITLFDEGKRNTPWAINVGIRTHTIQVLLRRELGTTYEPLRRRKNQTISVMRDATRRMCKTRLTKMPKTVATPSCRDIQPETNLQLNRTHKPKHSGCHRFFCGLGHIVETTVWLTRKFGCHPVLANTLPDLHLAVHAASHKARMDLLSGESLNGQKMR